MTQAYMRVRAPHKVAALLHAWRDENPDLKDSTFSAPSVSVDEDTDYLMQLWILEKRK